MTLPPAGHVEVRETRSGDWTVWYSDPGFIPCAPVCDLGKVNRTHKHSYEQAMIETNYTPTSYQDALEWANLLAEGREVKVIGYMTQAERRAQAS